MRRSLLLAVLAGSLLTACGSAGSTPSDAGGSPGESGVVALVPAALQFSAPKVGGGTIDFAQYAGRPVVLWFWAPT